MTVSTTLMLMFVFSLCLSLVLTPGVRALGIKLGAMDIPEERKVHTAPIPRIGGLAVFLSVMITGIVFNLFNPVMRDLYVLNFNACMGHLGAIIVLSCGLWDDFRRLNPWIKLFFQIVAATIAFIGGATINGIFFNGTGIEFGLMSSYLITVFWFLLFINAVNLVDGLDGLAGGLIFFTCTVMTISSYIHGEYLSAFYFAITGGAVLGFLKYNFNPATVFLGDGGSYVLGYTVAILAIRSSAKSNVGVLMLIPLLALGIPIFDSILSPIRRFLQGKSIFHPDKEHIHHMLMKLGLSSQKVVYLIYCITLVFCVFSILIITLRDNNLDGLILGAILIGMIILVRKLGYFEYLAFDKFMGWFQDMTDVAGFSQNRRSFLSLQISTNNSQNMDELWAHIVEALEMLNFHYAKLYLVNEAALEWAAKDDHDPETHSANDLRDMATEDKESILKFEIPLREYGVGHFFGKLVMIKDLKRGYLKPYTIRRVEHLRRTLIPVLKRLKQKPV
ncbi:MAG TPA: MraY family glycosyltransferase [Smithella sp.]|nr:MraY family glycosyltransferase [Smithella sp.]